MPCSAAIVIGIVCDAEAARRELEFSRSRKRSANDPEPKPQTGRSMNMSSPPPSSSNRPLVALSSGFSEFVSMPTCPGAATTTISAISPTAPTPARTGHGRQRTQAITISPTIRAAKLDCENVSTSPPQSRARTSAVSAISRGRLSHSRTSASATITSAR